MPLISDFRMCADGKFRDHRGRLRKGDEIVRRKTQNAERDAKILADYQRGIRTTDLVEHYGLQRQAIYAILRNQHKVEHKGAHEANKRPC